LSPAERRLGGRRRSETIPNRITFDEIAAYDGNETERPWVERGATSGPLWHELALVA
jgi:hypothetical protein